MFTKEKVVIIWVVLSEILKCLCQKLVTFPERHLKSSLKLPVNLSYLRKHTTWIPNALHYSQDDSTTDVTKFILQFS